MCNKIGWFRGVFFIAVLTLGNVLGFGATQFYVSATANGTGDGSYNNPWKLQQALSSPAALNNPTDTIWVWVLGGTYTNTYDAQNAFVCLTKGTANAPIIFRNYKDQRVTIDGQLQYTMAFVLGNCSYTWIWGLEFTNSSTADRDHPSSDRLGNIYCTAENIHFINLVVHDMGSGLDLWKTSLNSESYGCIIYNIGNNLNNGGNWEGHGHGMYLQNDTFGVKRIHNNIIFNTFAYGVKVWQTTTTAPIGNFDIQRNIVFNGGVASENLGGVGNNSRTHNFFMVANGVNNPIVNTVVKHNYTYAGINSPRPPVNAFGLNYGVRNFVLDSNYLTCQTRLGFNNTPVFDASVKGNKIMAGIPTVYGYYLWGFNTTDYPQNDYVSTVPNTGLEYFILPNRYEPKRSHLVVYNWDSAATVTVNVSQAGLQKGEGYKLLNVMNLYEDIDSGVVDNNGNISIDMVNRTMGKVIGSSKPSTSQFPKFGAFVLIHTGKMQSSNVGLLQVQAEMYAYPNPSGGKTTLHTNFSGKVDIVDIQGRLVKTLVAQNEGTNEMVVEGLKPGIYYLVHAGIKAQILCIY